MREMEVIIVGGGPAGLATAACLKKLSISSMILEKEACTSSLWKYRTYNRLCLHLHKNFCALPHFPHSKNTPIFMSKDQFINYLDDYVQFFDLDPIFNMKVISATFNDDDQKWLVVAEDTVTGEFHEHKAKFLVVATGENASKKIPLVPGLSTFTGETIHSSEYKSAMEFTGKNVLVVGCGNSGMEIAYDLSNSGAKTSMLVRGPFHVTTKEMIYTGMLLLKFLPINVIDKVVISLAKDYFGDLSEYGIVMPEKGPFTIKATTGRAAVIDVGTIDKIKAGLIKVYNTTIEKIGGDEVVFSDGRSECFDAIIFATGYTSTAHMWLKDNEQLLNDEGFPKQSYPNHWKGRNGVYCVGLARNGVPGISIDAENVAKDISKHLIN